MQAAKPRKQRRRLFQAPDHVRYKHFAASLSPELKTSHGVTALPVRSGDTVQIMRGDYKGFEGKVTRVDRKRYRIYVEGVTREKIDGTTIFVPIHPSKITITNLNLEDKWRRQVLDRKRKGREIVEGISAKPSLEEITETKEVAERKIPKRKRRKRRLDQKPAEKRVEEAPKRRKKEKKSTKKNTKEHRKENGTKKTPGRSKKTKRTKGGT